MEQNMNISDFYGKSIESTSGKKGYVLSVNVIGEKVECLVCADEDEKEFTVDFKNIVSTGYKIVYVDRAEALKKAKPVKLGRAGFDCEGNFLGFVEDISIKGGKLLKAKIGKKYYPAETLVCGDAVLAIRGKKLKSDVIKDGKIIFRKGTAVTEEILKKAEAVGEYVQTNLKSI